MRNFVTRVLTRAYLVVAETRDESGQALIEYALIISLISVIGIGALSATGTNILGLLNQVAADV